MKIHVTLRLAGPVLAALGLVGACSDSRPNTSSGPGPSISRPPPASTAPPAKQTGADLCSAPIDDAGAPAPLLELEVSGEPPPPLGGTPGPGTYDLSEMYAYVSADAGDPDADPHNTIRPSGRSAQATLVVTSDSLRLSTAFGTGQVGPPAVRAVSYRVEGTSLVAAEICPDRGKKETLPFSAPSADGVAIFPDANHRMVFTRR